MSETSASLQLDGSFVREIHFSPSRNFRLSALKAPGTEQERQVTTQYDLCFPSVLYCRFRLSAEPWLEIKSYKVLMSSDFIQQYVQQAGLSESKSNIQHFQFTLEEGYIDIISEQVPDVSSNEMPHLGKASRPTEPGALGIEQAKDPVAETELTCSFCGKRESEVAKIIAGPAVSICDECVASCSELIEEKTDPE